MPAPNPNNPQCPECGKQTKHKRQNQDGTHIYICSHCGWSNSVKRIPRSPLKRKEINAIAYRYALEYLKQPTYRGSYVDISEAIKEKEKWLFSCDELVQILKKIIEDQS